MAQAKPTKKAADSPKVMDMKKAAGASPTSRQVIVENRSIAQDPMMAQVSKLTGASSNSAAQNDTIPGEIGPVEHEAEATGAPTLTPAAKKVAIKVARSNKMVGQAGNDEKTDETGPSLAPSKKRIVIQPLSTTDAKDDSVEPAADEPAAAKIVKSEPTIADLAKPDPLEGIAADPKKEDIATEKPVPKTDKEEPQKEAEPATEPSPAKEEIEIDDTAATNQEPAAVVESEPEEATTDDTADDAQGDAVISDLDEKPGKKKQKKAHSGGELTPEQQKSVEAGEYFLPITTAETRRLRKELLFATLFILVVLVIWFDIMLDAELLKVGGVKAVTNFFK